MNCTIRQWRPEDAAALAELLNNHKAISELPKSDIILEKTSGDTGSPPMP